MNVNVVTPALHWNHHQPSSPSVVCVGTRSPVHRNFPGRIVKQSERHQARRIHPGDQRLVGRSPNQPFRCHRFPGGTHNRRLIFVQFIGIRSYRHISSDPSYPVPSVTALPSQHIGSHIPPWRLEYDSPPQLPRPGERLLPANAESSVGRPSSAAEPGTALRKPALVLTAQSEAWADVARAGS